MDLSAKNKIPLLRVALEKVDIFSTEFSSQIQNIVTEHKEPGTGRKFVMFVMPGNRKFDADKIKSHIGLVDIRFATEQEVSEITSGTLPGGVPPFGNIFNLEVFADKALFDNEKIVFNAGDKSYSIGMKSSDYKKVVDPVVADICQ